ncbi:MAG: RHS repeat-associated core domain-containing protein [Nanoarchaeota archaeon]|nr:RHS repeat-associated core domain-containing protein [Nanoarchaeota archaeon]
MHLVLNESGDVIEENLFSPFAEPIAGVKENKFSYEAKEFDSLTKDYNFNFRMFSPNGPPIFNQPDTLIQNVYDAQSLNRYSFERNNPYKYTDPTGHCVDACLTELAFVVAALGYTVYFQETGQFLNKVYHDGATKRDWLYFGLNTLLTFGTAGIGKSAETLLGVTVPAFNLDNLVTDILEEATNPKKEETQEDLKCKIINCNFKYEVSGGDNERNGQSDSPSTSNPSSQADSSKAISQSAQQSANQASSGYIQGVGYVTSGGATYPTSNPYFVPGTGNQAWGGSYSNVVQNPSTGNWEIAE